MSVICVVRGEVPQGADGRGWAGYWVGRGRGDTEMGGSDPSRGWPGDVGFSPCQS